MNKEQQFELGFGVFAAAFNNFGDEEKRLITKAGHEEEMTQEDTVYMQNYFMKNCKIPGAHPGLVAEACIHFITDLVILSGDGYVA